MNNPTCIKCGQLHPRCTAHNRQGSPCRTHPVPGLTVCRLHGGATPVPKNAATRRLAAAKAATDVARFNARTDLDPADALLDLVHYQAGIVHYWRDRIEQIAADDLEWGTTKVKTGGDDEGTTDEAKPNIAYVMLREAQHDLATYAAATLKAGVAERQVRLAEAQGAMLATAIRAILDALNLTPDQQALVPTVVPAQLRLLTAAAN